MCTALGYSGGMDVVISIPGGAEVAARTFNPKLGIVGGLSILGKMCIRDSQEVAAAGIYRRVSQADHGRITPCIQMRSQNRGGLLVAHPARRRAALHGQRQRYDRLLRQIHRPGGNGERRHSPALSPGRGNHCAALQNTQRL